MTLNLSKLKTLSILNVLLRPDRLVIAVDTLAESAQTGQRSAGAKLLLVPQHNAVLATRGSAQFFLEVFRLLIEASFRPEFTIELAMAEAGPLVDHIWPRYELASRRMHPHTEVPGIELVLGGWSQAQQRMVATAYARGVGARATTVRLLDAGLASPGTPLEGRQGSYEHPYLLEAARLQCSFLNAAARREVAGGNLLVADMSRGCATITDLGPLRTA